ncbi:MAG: PilT/PilU family type 4a pilus ATPase [Candidatus Eisenbacteria bacterium]|nr:PilT/PilU family type 4a pilus ATPase [Candidatus Eisenbacteria bacterium]
MVDIIQVLVSMVPTNSSDLYFTAGAPVQRRVNGSCQPASELITAADTKAIADFFMSETQKEEFRATREMNLAYSIPNVGRYRVNIFVQRGAVGLVIRLVKIQIPTMDELGLPQILRDLVMLRKGLVLVTGPTGTGKSTTLASMIDYRNDNDSGHILTVEDPIEFVHPHKKSLVTQREVGMDTDSYHAALKNALRQAPDVVLIGEIRDAVAMEAAITFAETGHLVLGTLHTLNANQTIDRVLSFFPRGMHDLIYLQLSLTLAGIVCQRLIPCQDGQGRRAALEILMTTPRIRDQIHKGEVAALKVSMEESTQEGCQTFDQALYKLWKDGVISLEEALRNAESANNLKVKIRMENPGLSIDADAPKLSLHRLR